jgi:hypothetical protein
MAVLCDFSIYQSTHRYNSLPFVFIRNFTKFGDSAICAGVNRNSKKRSQQLI